MDFEPRSVWWEPINKLFHELLQHKSLGLTINCFLIIEHSKPEINQNFWKELVERLHWDNSNSFWNPNLSLVGRVLILVYHYLIEEFVRYISLRLGRYGYGLLDLAPDMVLDNHSFPDHGGLSINIFLKLLLVNLFLMFTAPWLCLIKIKLIHLVLCTLV